MVLNNGNKLNTQDIEFLNAHGPYTMAVWKSGDINIGYEEGLAGRSEYFVKKIREAIQKNFTNEQLKTMSILDIGCNDGWVLHQLSDMPFMKMVGIEPREKNIEKGRVVRKILNLENNVEYKVGTIEELKGEVYDIVLCNGLLYHVESIPQCLRNLRNVCSKMIFIESRCISSCYITDELRAEIEMRDLVYQFKDEICGITAQKYESAYHDGSAAHTTIVNVPSTESLVMNLNILGFENIDIVADPDTYREAVWKDKRPLGGVCITATLPNKPIVIESEEDKWIDNYEKALEHEVFDRDFIEPLYEIYTLKQDRTIDDSFQGIISYINSAQSGKIVLELSNLPLKSQNKIAFEIIKNFRYRPDQKIALEYGKLLYQEKDFNNAIEVLKGITTQINADWRAVYRSNFILYKIYNELNDAVLSKKYLNYCLKGNPKYPIA